MSEENVEVVRRVVEAFMAGVERGDFAAAWSTGDLAADTEWVAFPELDPTTYRGREGFVEFMRTWSEDFERLSFRIERLIPAGDDRVVALLHQSAIGKGSGVPVAGRGLAGRAVREAEAVQRARRRGHPRRGRR